MNTDNLTEGMTVKNYKEMCKLLGEEEKSGSSKKSQLKEWSRHFEFTKYKQSFIIDEIYDYPIPLECKPNAIYTKLIEVILLEYLSNQTNNTCHITSNEIYLMLGMVSKEYRSLNNADKVGMKILSNKYEIEERSLIDFKRITKARLRNILKSALVSMERRFLIRYEREVVIVNTNGVPIIATDDDIDKLLNIQNQVLDDMGLKDSLAVYYNFKQEEFYKQVNSRLQEKYNWQFSYTQFKICYSKESIERNKAGTITDLMKIINLFDISAKKQELNESIMATIKNSAQSNIDTMHKLWDRDWGMPDRMSNTGRRVMRMACYENEDYLSNIEKAIDLFINRTNAEICADEIEDKNFNWHDDDVFWLNDL